tara:strand:+ start:722 stop:1138 length:417 start_codon:yes stop_codon:yes gene_type:complete
MEKLIESISIELNNLQFNYDVQYNIQYLDEIINTNYNLNELINIIKYNLVLSETNKIIKYYNNLIDFTNQNLIFDIENKSKQISNLLLSNNKLFFIDYLVFKVKISFNNALEYLNDVIDIKKKNKSIFLTITFLKNIN